MILCFYEKKRENRCLRKYCFSYYFLRSHQRAGLCLQACWSFNPSIRLYWQCMHWWLNKWWAKENHELEREEKYASVTSSRKRISQFWFLFLIKYQVFANYWIRRSDQMRRTVQDLEFQNELGGYIQKTENIKFKFFSTFFLLFLVHNLIR